MQRGKGSWEKRGTTNFQFEAEEGKSLTTVQSINMLSIYILSITNATDKQCTKKIT